MFFFPFHSSLLELFSCHVPRFLGCYFFSTFVFLLLVLIGD
uniref:Uncharacterized protein n=1 Tax=Rhizophora mucronata TaxID=61149 RepID=A0A2P2NRY0_RHIMU